MTDWSSSSFTPCLQLRLYLGEKITLKERKRSPGGDKTTIWTSKRKTALWPKRPPLNQSYKSERIFKPKPYIYGKAPPSLKIKKNAGRVNLRKAKSQLLKKKCWWILLMPEQVIQTCTPVKSPWYQGQTCGGPTGERWNTRRQVLTNITLVIFLNTFQTVSNPHIHILLPNRPTNRKYFP